MVRNGYIHTDNYILNENFGAFTTTKQRVKVNLARHFIGKIIKLNSGLNYERLKVINKNGKLPRSCRRYKENKLTSLFLLKASFFNSLLCCLFEWNVRFSYTHENDGGRLWIHKSGGNILGSPFYFCRNALIWFIINFVRYLWLMLASLVRGNTYILPKLTCHCRKICNQMTIFSKFNVNYIGIHQSNQQRLEQYLCVQISKLYTEKMRCCGICAFKHWPAIE